MERAEIFVCGLCRCLQSGFCEHGSEPSGSSVVDVFLTSLAYKNFSDRFYTNQLDKTRRWMHHDLTKCPPIVYSSLWLQKPAVRKLLSSRNIIFCAFQCDTLLCQCSEQTNLNTAVFINEYNVYVQLRNMFRLKLGHRQALYCVLSSSLCF